jgi:hypothetical protein
MEGLEGGGGGRRGGDRDKGARFGRRGNERVGRSGGRGRGDGRGKPAKGSKGLALNLNKCKGASYTGQGSSHIIYPWYKYGQAGSHRDSMSSRNNPSN